MTRKKKVLHELVLFSDRGSVLCKGGTFATKSDAKDAVNGALDQLPQASCWKIIKVTKEIVEEGRGFTRRRSTPAPSGQERWW